MGLARKDLSGSLRIDLAYLDNFESPLLRRRRREAVAALTEHYATAFREWEAPAILDICASHVSHFPPDVAEYTGRRVALGMNEVCVFVFLCVF